MDQELPLPSPPSPPPPTQTQELTGLSFEQLYTAYYQFICEVALPPTKIKRQYKCTLCDHNTENPRTHLRHRKWFHGQKIKIVECPYCLYACQYRQKLSRHLKLVHKILQHTPTPRPLPSPTTDTYQLDLEMPIDLTIPH